MIMSPPPNRSIRFAPLPDPRRSVLVADDGREVPFSPDQLSPESPQFNRAETPISPTKIPAAVSIAATGSFSKKASLFRNLALSDTSSSSSSTSESVETSSPTRNSSTSSLGGAQTPTQSKLMNLFRTTSRGDATPQPSWGHPLQRWTSGGSNASSTYSTVSAPVGGVPMRRTMSTQSAKSKNKSLFGFITKSNQARRGSTASDVNGMLATLHNSSPQSRKGTRMLNGRIYGARRNPSANPFANVHDEPDPEFVEWGYGGMGSVRHGAQVGGRVWDKLMSDDTTYAEPSKGLGDDDMDDGSGMGWVRRRREQREREKLEKEAKENEKKKEGAEAEKESERKKLIAEESQSPPESVLPALGSLPSPQQPHSILSPSKPGTPCLGTPITSPSLMSPPALSPQHSYGSHPGSAVASPATDDEHLTTAINIPAPRSRHHHHKRDSVHHPVDAIEEVDDAHLQDSEKRLPEEAEDETSKTAQSNTSTSSISSSSTSTSGSETESGTDSDSESEDEDDEDDEQSQEARKTSVGAGVEKISRHKT